MEKWLMTQRPKYDHEPKNGEEMSLSRVGKELYEKASKIHFEHTTISQGFWNYKNNDYTPF